MRECLPQFWARSGDLTSAGESANLFEKNGKIYAPGTVYIPAKSVSLDRLRAVAREPGLNIESADVQPQGEALRLRTARVGLWDIYGGSMASGWARWILEQFEFPYEVVFPPDLDGGNLNSKFDVLIFVGGGVPLKDTDESDETRRFAPPKPEEIPEEYRSRLGTVTVAKTVPQLRAFLEAGGSILALGSSTSLGYHSGLPLSDALIEKLEDGSEKRLTTEKFYIPGSILQVKVDNGSPLAYGMNEKTHIYFNNSPVFSLHPDAVAKGVRPVAWFDNPSPLRSGWAWGQHYLNEAVAVIEAQVGRGKLFLFGPEIIFRGQPHGTFKFLFNGIFYGAATTVNIQ
jgi:hypothetical protein